MAVAEESLGDSVSQAQRRRLPSMPVIAWRNLWRNRRRTWLAAGGIAFAAALVQFSMSLQVGSYDVLIESGAGFLAGHLQVQAAEYTEEQRFEALISDVERLAQRLRARPEVLSLAPRVEAFGLASASERSFGVQVLGVDVARERQVVSLLDSVRVGRAPEAADEGVLGSGLARNLGVGLNDEVVVLGSGKAGGVAAMVVRVSGLLESGVTQLDRTLMLMPIAAVQSAYLLDDEAHTLVLRARDVDQTAALAQALRAELPDGLVARTWREVLPELQQSIDLDMVSGAILYGVVILVVTFSVINTFIMTVFERTREFGMLRAIGMRPAGIIGLLQWEAAGIWLLGTLLALAASIPAIALLSVFGLPIGDEAMNFSDMVQTPDALYPKITWEVLVAGPLVLLAGVQLAAFLPALRIRKLQPVAALRAE